MEEEASPYTTYHLQIRLAALEKKCYDPNTTLLEQG
jgi:hypothetical protein